MRSKLISTVAIIALLSACAERKATSLDPSAIPATWHTNAAGQIQSNTTSSQQWWQRFGDPTLDQLIQMGINQNHDLKIMVARINQAKSLRKEARAETYPDLNITSGSSRQRRTLGSLSSSTYSSYDLGLEASWEVDLFGRLNAALDAATADVGAAEQDLQDVTISLMADIATEYVTYRYWQQQWSLANANYLAAERSLSLISKLTDAGLKDPTDFEKAQGRLKVLSAEKQESQKQQRQTQLRLEQLLGQHAGALDQILSQPQTVPPSFDGKVVLSTPADVVNNRPDVRAAALRLDAASARFRSARQQQYPTFTLSGLLGLSSNSLGDLFKTSSKAWTIADRTIYPLLNFGRIDSVIDLNKAKEAEAAESYKKAVLAALIETESSLDSLWQNQQKERDLAAAVSHEQRAFDLATNKFDQGVISYLDVLDAERSLYDAKTQHNRTRLDQFIDTINFYRSVGGGSPVQEVTTTSQEPSS